jgi:hypothetical protein
LNGLRARRRDGHDMDDWLSAQRLERSSQRRQRVWIPSLE